MKKVVEEAVANAPPLSVGRKGLASFLLAFLRPGDAKGATLHSKDVTLDLLSRSLTVDFGQIETVEIEKGWFGHSVKIRLTDGEKAVSGLPGNQARALADGLEAARVYWWQKTLNAQHDLIQSAYNDISKLAAPTSYMRFSLFSILERNASQVVTLFPRSSPKQLSSSSEIKKLDALRSFIQDSDGHRARANRLFVKEELERTKNFFDTIESQPLTDEQRKAVVIDEDHNLVVAAAGSGKTSVIVAKAGWLVNKGYRSPSELLLLAYAKDAQIEMEERVQRRLGNEVASDLAVRTFHGLGLSIIGEAEGNVEERRLFYVAMTRARRRVVLLADGGQPSPFIKELLDGEYSVEVFGRLPEKDVSCPVCVEGHLVQRAGSNGTFFGCSNWPYCSYTQSACPHCSQGLPIKSSTGFVCRDCGHPIENCPRCDGWLQKKSGKYGLFYGCSNWPSCNYTRNAN